MKKYYNSSGQLTTYSSPSTCIFYDDVVDKSLFRPDSENVRLGSGGSFSGVPVYDDHDLSDLEVKIRSGKLDKAEISQLQLSKAKELEDEVSKAKKDKAKKELEQIETARQKHLDDMVGFTGKVQDS